jgi:hypothetical protein
VLEDTAPDAPPTPYSDNAPEYPYYYKPDDYINVPELNGPEETHFADNPGEPINSTQSVRLRFRTCLVCASQDKDLACFEWGYEYTPNPEGGPITLLPP